MKLVVLHVVKKDCTPFSMNHALVRLNKALKRVYFWDADSNWKRAFVFQIFILLMHLSMSSRWAGRRGIGRDFDRSLWPRGRAFELSCCPGGRDIWIFVRARDHKSFPRRGISVIFDLTFLPGGREFDSNFFENVKIPPYALPPPPHWLDIDRCIIHRNCNMSTFLKLSSVKSTIFPIHSL